MVRDTALKPTTAMRLAGITDETVQRRLRRKWKVVDSQYLIEARERRHAETVEAWNNGLRHVAEIAGRVAYGAHIIGEQITTGLTRWARDNPGVIEAVRDLSNRKTMLIAAKAMGAERV